MAPHLVTAQCAYKDIWICSFLHTHAHTHSTNTHTLSLSLSHTHYKYMLYWWWVGRMRRKKMTDHNAEEKRWVFSSNVREWRRMPDSESIRVPDRRSNVLKGSLSHSPPAHPRNTEYLRLSEESKKEQRWSNSGMEELHQRQCGSRWELLCTESRYWLVACGYRRVKEWCGQELCRWGELSSWSLWIWSRNIIPTRLEKGPPCLCMTTKSVFSGIWGILRCLENFSLADLAGI